MKKNLHIFKDSDELNYAAVMSIIEYIRIKLEIKETFSMVLAGGNTPKKLYSLLASAEYKDEIDWSRIIIFWGDERFVPYDDDRNNAKMAFDTLLNFVPIPKKNIFRIETENISAIASAEKYNEQIQNNILIAFSDDKMSMLSFDLVILGMGDDGHTLSVFPGYDNIIFEKNKYCISFLYEAQQMTRITLTPNIVNHADVVLFLVTGKSKQPVLQEVLFGDYNPSKYPVQAIKLINGKDFWLVDEDAFISLQ